MGVLASVSVNPAQLLRYPEYTSGELTPAIWSSLVRVASQNDERLKRMIESITVSATVGAGSSGGGSGTVTSVGLAGVGLSSFLGITGSPVSTNGNFSLNFVSGAAGQYLQWNGTWASASAQVFDVSTINCNNINALATVSASVMRATIEFRSPNGIVSASGGSFTTLNVAATASASVGLFSNVISEFSAVSAARVSTNSAIASVNTIAVDAVQSVGLLPTGLSSFLTIAGSPVSSAGNFTLTFTSGPTNTYLGNNGTWVSISVAGGAASWGGISGTLSDQTDLNNALTSIADTVTSTNAVLGVVISILTINDIELQNSITSVNNTLTARDKYFYCTDLFGAGTPERIWAFGAIGSGTGPFNSREGHPGVMTFQRVSTAANSGYRMNSNLVGNYFYGGESTNMIIQFHNALTSLVGYFGFHDSNTATVPTDGSFFHLVPGGGIQGVNRANNVSVSTGVLLSAAVSTWYLFNISVAPVSPSAVYYRILDMDSSVLASANLNTNIPASTARAFGHSVVFFYQASAAADGLQLADIDYADVTFSPPVSSRGGI